MVLSYFDLALRGEGPVRMWVESLGEGTSPCLGPVSLVLFASRVQEDIPERPEDTTEGRVQFWQKRLRQALAALDQAERFFPEGEDLLPLDAADNRVAEFALRTRRERFGRTAIEGDRAALRALLEQWDAS